MSKEAFLSAIEEAIVRMRKASSEVVLVHHDDADGLASASVLHVALSRAGFSVRRIPLERVHPLIVARIHELFPSTILYVDLGGMAAPMISKVNRGQRFTVILDHHHPGKSTDPEVLNISTESFGLSGEMDISAATAAYFFALVLDEKNRDLAYLSVVGGVGDAHDRGGCLVGENRQALMDAVSQGQVHIEEEDDREHYALTRFRDSLPMAVFAKQLTTLGAAGFNLGGPDLGVRMCIEGPFQEAQQKFEELNQLKMNIYDKALAQLKQEGFRVSKHTQWFMVGDDFAPMGVKTIGDFCRYVRNEDFADPDKYVVGFQNMPTEIPGLGVFDWSLVKVSMRVPSPLEKKIVVDHLMPGLAYLVPEAAKKVDGSIDACHDYAAATLIEVGREDELIAAMDKLVEAK